MYVGTQKEWIKNEERERGRERKSKREQEIERAATQKGRTDGQTEKGWTIDWVWVRIEVESECGDESFGISIVHRSTFCSSTDVAFRFRFRFHFHSLLGCSELDILSTFSYGFLLQEIEQLIAYLYAVRFFIWWFYNIWLQFKTFPRCPSINGYALPPYVFGI